MPGALLRDSIDFCSSLRLDLKFKSHLSLKETVNVVFFVLGVFFKADWVAFRRDVFKYEI